MHSASHLGSALYLRGRVWITTIVYGTIAIVCELQISEEKRYMPVNFSLSRHSLSSFFVSHAEDSKGFSVILRLRRKNIVRVLNKLAEVRYEST